MNLLTQLMRHEIVYAIGWTLIHSIWQCCLVALLIAVSYLFTKKSSAATRYWINTVGLLACVIISGVTFYLNYHAPSTYVDIVSATPGAEISPNNSQAYTITASYIVNKYINLVVAAWLIGFTLFTSKFIGELFYCQHIKNNHYKTPNQEFLKIFIELKNRVGITQNIQLRLSGIVNIPCVVGYFKPVVLLPASMVLALSAKQIEVILLHELGHIRRNDYLMNSIQTMISLLYFFNPFAQWIASRIDEERENACDDIAVAVSGDAMFYANTLKEFTEMQKIHPSVVAMAGRKNLLLNRIKRLLIHDISSVKTYGKAATIMGIFLLTIGYSITGHSHIDSGSNNTFTIKLDNEPLSSLLTNSEQRCLINIDKATLQHLDQVISGNFPGLRCDTVENFIRGMDRSLDSTITGISIDEKEIALKNLVAKIEHYCPEIEGKIQLENPETLVGFKSENTSCYVIKSFIKRMDTNQKGTSLTIGKGKIDSITFSDQGPDEYDKVFFKEFYQPKEIQEKDYAGNCTLTLDVDTNGQAININPVCTSPTAEQKLYFENLISERAKQTRFPIKMEHGQAVGGKDIAIRVVWRNRT